MRDYLIAGSPDIHSIWPETTRQCNKLVCEHGHGGICSWENGCCVGDQTIRFNVIPIANVDGLDSTGFDALFLVTPSKKHLKVDVTLATTSIRNFSTCLQECQSPLRISHFRRVAGLVAIS